MARDVGGVVWVIVLDVLVYSSLNNLELQLDPYSYWFWGAILSIAYFDTLVVLDIGPVENFPFFSDHDQFFNPWKLCSG